MDVNIEVVLIGGGVGDSWVAAKLGDKVSIRTDPNKVEFVVKEDSVGAHEVVGRERILFDTIDKNGPTSTGVCNQNKTISVGKRTSIWR